MRDLSDYQTSTCHGKGKRLEILHIANRKNAYNNNEGRVHCLPRFHNLKFIACKREALRLDQNLDRTVMTPGGEVPHHVLSSLSLSSFTALQPQTQTHAHTHTHTHIRTHAYSIVSLRPPAAHTALLENEAGGNMEAPLARKSSE